MEWEPASPREQVELPVDPYDRWVSPTGHCQAEFYRDERGYLIRFPSQADFLIEQGPSVDSGFRVTGWPAPQCEAKTTINLYHNAIQPILGNHSGGLFLHGSAVFARAEDQSGAQDGAIAFLGLSRSGKTTLAGSFAQAGHPFLTEDVIDLVNENGRYWLQPKRSKLRLFADSARHLLGSDTQFDNDDTKQDVDAGAGLPFADAAHPLRQIYVLGTDLRADLSIRQFSLQEALAALLPNAFILDVEDKPNLRAHFSRLADLSQDIPCYTLDFTRDYSELPRVRKAVLDNLTKR
ncbi:hypothetical protein CD351_00585 [Erythrobacter sp. KY5]|uniref:hypothetical protein n=1 Tax=Erythrobacter sp. KY5 TaxID=2011159 RepID=UPI000DBF2442|nr:hypothetical protein [Erythrobacter sp. KY5]AWW72918.1 hypothetical protein CD351_00585 [Erythrobacter sp. KY5]